MVLVTISQPIKLTRDFPDHNTYMGKKPHFLGGEKRQQNSSENSPFPKDIKSEAENKAEAKSHKTSSVGKGLDLVRGANSKYKLLWAGGVHN